MACEDFSSMTWEWARSASNLNSSPGMTGSSRGLICQLGLLVHAADVSGSLRAANAMGRWVAIIRASTLSGTSAARGEPDLSALTSTFVPLVPSGKVYGIRSTDEAKSPPGNRSRQLFVDSPTPGIGEPA